MNHINQTIADVRQQPMASVSDLVSFVTGRTLSEPEVHSYNQYTRDFNRSTYTLDKEQILDRRHAFITACFYQGSKV